MAVVLFKPQWVVVPQISHLCLSPSRFAVWRHWYLQLVILRCRWFHRPVWNHLHPIEKGGRVAEGARKTKGIKSYGRWAAGTGTTVISLNIDAYRMYRYSCFTCWHYRPFVRGLHWRPVDSPRRGRVMPKWLIWRKDERVLYITPRNKQKAGCCILSVRKAKSVPLLYRKYITCIYSCSHEYMDHGIGSRGIDIIFPE